MGRTTIEWTRGDDGSPGHSWPVINGCRRISAGCENCYAERLTATRLSKTPKYQGLAVFGKNGPRWTGESRLWAPHLDMPLRLKKPSRIFVADMGDLFYEGVSNEEIAAVFGVMAACPQHTFQVLTKRPERAREWFRWAAAAPGFEHIGPMQRTGVILRHHAYEWITGTGARFDQKTLAPWPLPNVWLGVSIEDQVTADERIPVLLDIPAALRFVSAEPLIGPVDLDPNMLGGVGHLAATFGNPLVNWVIVGGESGPGARPFDLGWAVDLAGQCREAGAACFVKQLGARPFSVRRGEVVDWRFKDRKAGDMEEWPTDLRVREFPTERLNQGRLVEPEAQP